MNKLKFFDSCKILTLWNCCQKGINKYQVTELQIEIQKLLKTWDFKQYFNQNSFNEPAYTKRLFRVFINGESFWF